jgi:hypothetical protein
LIEESIRSNIKAYAEKVKVYEEDEEGRERTIPS